MTTNVASDVRYYGLRDYLPRFGRWGSRDIVGDGILSGSLYCLLHNQPAVSVDVLGAYQLDFKGAWTQAERTTIESAFSQLPTLLFNRAGVLEQAQTLLPSCADCCGKTKIAKMVKTLRNVVSVIDDVFAAVLPGGDKVPVRKGVGWPTIDSRNEAQYSYWKVDPSSGWFVFNSSPGRFFQLPPMTQSAAVFHEVMHKEEGVYREADNTSPPLDAWKSTEKLTAALFDSDLPPSMAVISILEKNLATIADNRKFHQCMACLRRVLSSL